jgi:hypothetical protein
MNQAEDEAKYVERMKTDCDLCDFDISCAAEKAFVKVLGEGKYKKAKDIAERFGLDGELQIITGILNRLDG